MGAALKLDSPGNPDKDWRDFWSKVVMKPNGSIDMDQLKKSLSDFKFIIDNLKPIYQHISGSDLPVMSFAHKVIEAYDDRMKEYDKKMEIYRDNARQEVLESIADIWRNEMKDIIPLLIRVVDTTDLTLQAGELAYNEAGDVGIIIFDEPLVVTKEEEEPISMWMGVSLKNGKDRIWLSRDPKAIGKL